MVKYDDAKLYYIHLSVCLFVCKFLKLLFKQNLFYSFLLIIRFMCIIVI